MEITMRGIPMFELGITLEHVAVLIEVSSRHYDGACRAAGYDTAKPMGRELGGRFPRENGFLVLWQRRLEPWPPPPEVATVPPVEKIDADWRELDTCLKVLEYAGTVYSRKDPDNERKRLLAAEMFVDFNHAMNVARDAMKTWKAVKPERRVGE